MSWAMPILDQVGRSLVTGKANTRTIAATVEQLAFTGLNFHLHARTPAGRAIMAVIPASQQSAIADLNPGSAVKLGYDPTAVHIIPGEAA